MFRIRFAANRSVEVMGCRGGERVQRRTDRAHGCSENTCDDETRHTRREEVHDKSGEEFVARHGSIFGANSPEKSPDEEEDGELRYDQNTRSNERLVGVL
jgi:hypothetical protein